MTTNISGQGLILLPLFGGRKKIQRRWPLKANFWILIRFIIDLRHKEREDLTLCAYRYNKLKFWWISHDLMEQSEILHHFKMFRRRSQSMQDYSHMQMTFASLRTPKWTLALDRFFLKGSSRWLLSVKSIITTLKIFRLKVLSCFFSLCNSLLQALQRLRNGLGPQCKTAC